MATAICAGPSLWVFSSKRAQCRSSAEPNPLSHVTPSSLTCKLESHVKQAFPGSRSLTSKKRTSALIAHSVERLGLDGKLSEEDASGRSAIEEESSLELVDTDGIIFEDSEEIDGMLRQPRSFDDWEMYAAEEGARPAADDETDSEGEDAARPVRRRSAGDALPFPAANWSAADKQKVVALQAFKHRYESKGGLFLVEAMRPKHMADTEELLIDSFAELMGGLLTYRPLLAFTVKQYVRERYATLPHSVTLVGLYSPAHEEAGAAQQQEAGASSVVVAGTVELSFSVAGHPDVPTPAPPPNSPYICNMAIKKECRRRGLGRQMLKAAEELALSMGCEDMYLHVRIMDTAPLTMYREAGYQVVSTDSLLSVLTFQRRRHLMRKRLSRAKLLPEQQQ